MTTAAFTSTSLPTGVESANTAPRSKDATSIKEVIYASLRADAEEILKALPAERETELDGLLWKWAAEMACE